MKAFDEIQQLWNRQKPESNVAYDTILKRVGKKKNAFAKKLFWQSVAVGIAIVILLIIGLSVSFSTWTTYAALVIMIGCVCYYLVNQVRDYRNINNSHFLLSKPKDYIRYLKTFKQKRNRFNTRNYGIYEVCIGVAFALYAIELYFLLPFWTFLGFVLFVALWFLICHFIFMKQYIKSENIRIQEMIDHLERINEQFDDKGGGQG